MTKKVKLFKRIFLSNADHVIDVTTMGQPKEIVGYMSEEVFVPLMGQMWDKAKTKYHKKRKSVSLEFAEWCAENYQRDEHKGGYVWFCNNRVAMISTKELYDKWVELKRKG